MRHLRDLDFDPATLAFVAGDSGGRDEIVKNAPYTAEAVTGCIQVLADGNRIVKETRALLARDSFGRTRQERRGPHGVRAYVFDPIEGKRFALNPEARTAVRIPRVPTPHVAPVPPVPPVPPAPGVAPVPPIPPVPPLPPSPAVAPRAEFAPGRVVIRRSEAGHDEDVRVEVVRIARGEGIEHPAPWTLPLLPRGRGETTSLGTRDFGGVKAEGTKTTHTIAAGAIGNEKPIVVTTERWFSPELHVVVFAKTVDPRAGERTYRLVNLKREEPPADLFKVPAGYRSAGSRAERRHTAPCPRPGRRRARAPAGHRAPQGRRYNGPVDATLADRLDALLPQTQCTRCGFDACRPYAEAIAEGRADVNRCPPGGPATIAALAALTGRDPRPLDATCGTHAPPALARIDDARCIGCTLCIEACPVDAILGGPKRLHAVIASLCSGCGLCLPPCPVDCIELVPAPRPWTAADAAAARIRHRERSERRARGERIAARGVRRVDDDASERRRAVAAALERARARRAAGA